MQAIVADGSQVYLVKQGETFADQYRATSVDPILVLAVKVSPGQDAGNSFLPRQNPAASLHPRDCMDTCIFPCQGWQTCKLSTRWVHRAVRFSRTWA